MAFVDCSRASNLTALCISLFRINIATLPRNQNGLGPTLAGRLLTTINRREFPRFRTSVVVYSTKDIYTTSESCHRQESWSATLAPMAAGPFPSPSRKDTLVSAHNSPGLVDPILWSAIGSRAYISLGSSCLQPFVNLLCIFKILTNCRMTLGWNVAWGGGTMGRWFMPGFCYSCYVHAVGSCHL